MRVNNQKPNKIAVMRLSAMGDVAMLVPVLKAFNRTYPDTEIVVVSRPFFKPFFDGIPTISFYSVELKGRHKGLLGMYRLFKDVLKLKVTVFADLHNVLRSRIVGNFMRLKGIPVQRMDKGRSEKKKLTKLKQKEIKPIRPVFDRHVEVLKKLGYPLQLKPEDILPKSPLSDATFALIGNHDIKRIGIAPFAQHLTKVYPLEQLKETILDLLDDGSTQVLLFGGGSSEKVLLDELAKCHNNCINVTGQISFQEELALISNLDVMLSMDSGNGHMAAMYGVPVVTVWGNTHPFAGFVPFAQPLDNGITPDLEQFPFLPTSIYGNKKVEGYQDCIKTISPQKIAAKVKSLL